MIRVTQIPYLLTWENVKMAASRPSWIQFQKKCRWSITGIDVKTDQIWLNSVSRCLRNDRWQIPLSINMG